MASANPSSSGRTTRPVPYRRRIFGGPSKAQNMTVTRPFSRMWATVSMPDPFRSRYATVCSSTTANVPAMPFGDRLTWPPSSGAVATKKQCCASMNFRQRASISS